MGLNKELFNSDNYFKEYVTDLIKKTRQNYCSANPEQEKAENVYVEIKDLFK